MMTPIEIQAKTFKNSGMGYSKADVDGFFSNIAAEYEALYKENITLKEKINGLEANLSQYKELENALKKSLVLAETTADEIKLNAKKNATVIEQEAVLKAQTIVADAKVELERLHVKTADLIQQYDRYKAQYKALAAAQLEILDSDSFKMEVASFTALSNNLEKPEQTDELQAQPVYAAPESEEEADAKAELMARTQEIEDDIDETLASDDSMIKDFSEIFDDSEEVKG